jgi:hypothetical protein
MRHIQFVITASLLLLVLTTSHAATKEVITLSLPESLIAETTTALLPFSIDAHSRSLDGDITVIEISDLQLGTDKLSARLHLSGNNLAFATEIAGHTIKLKVGSVEVDFMMDGELRFDAKTQNLLIKPIVKDIKATGDSANAEIAQALVSLLNGREFPISVNKLDPLIAGAGAKTVTINTTIADIRAIPDMLLLQLTPEIIVQ